MPVEVVDLILLRRSSWPEFERHLQRVHVTVSILTRVLMNVRTDEFVSVNRTQAVLLPGGQIIRPLAAMCGAVR